MCGKTDYDRWQRWGQKNRRCRPERTPASGCKAFRQRVFQAAPELPAKKAGRSAALPRTKRQGIGSPAIWVVPRSFHTAFVPLLGRRLFLFSPVIKILRPEEDAGKTTRRDTVMQWTGLNELREKYLSFFESKGHLRLDSFPLVDRKSTRLNSSHMSESRMPSSA